MNMIHRWSRPETIENIKPIISSGVPGDSFMSQYHKINPSTRKIGGELNKDGTILIQSTLAVITSKNREWVSFRISIEENKHLQFFESLQKFTNRIKTITQKKYNKNIIWDDATNHKSGNTITLNGRIASGCLFYDVNGNKLKIDHDIKDNTVDFIFGISLVQIVSPIDEQYTLYGKIIIEIVQIRRHNFGSVVLEKYSFDTIAQNNSQQPYAKYFDMLKKGVPRKAVEQRILVDGLDIGILDGKMNTPPPIPHGKQRTGLVFSAEDLKNTKLKKTTQIKRQPKQRMGINLGISLESIQNSLKGLRKTRIISSFT